MISETERAARALSKRERIAYLKTRGWNRLDATGSQMWQDRQTDARYTLALAVRIAIEDENPPTDTPTLRAGFELTSAFNRMRFGGEPPVVCDGCHATTDRIAKFGHFGRCDRRGVHQHARGMEIKHCAEWLAHVHLLGEQAGLSPSPEHAAVADSTPLCLRRKPAGLPDNRAVHGYLEVALRDELPRQVDSDGHLVRHGYAVDAAGTWYFYSHLEPAIAVGRALRMSLDCPLYGVFRAAHETRYCARHGDERALVVVGDRLDRQPGEAVVIARFAAGVAQYPESSHWRAPKAGVR